MAENINIEELKNRAKQGDKTAQFNLAQLYKKGTKVEKNISFYKKWLEEAAKNGHSGAMKELGDCYANGVGVSVDEMAAISWYESAVSSNEISAHSKLATILLTGLRDSQESELPEELKRAEKLLRTASNKGDVESQFKLGLLYQMSLGGFTKDFLESERWLSKASEANHAGAQNALAYLYAFGSSDNKIKKDLDKALKWWIKSAENNNSEAQYNLGSLYAKKAIESWKKSAAAGDQKSRYMLNQMSGFDWE
jgi:TPR repeat protein